LLNGNVAVVIEVTRKWLKLAGTSTERLHQLLAAKGLEPFSFVLREGRFSRQLVVRPLSGPQDADQYDCLFMRPSSVFADRLKKVMDG